MNEYFTAAKAKEYTTWNKLPLIIRQSIVKAINNGVYECTISKNCPVSQLEQIFTNPWTKSHDLVSESIRNLLTSLGFKTETNYVTGINFKKSELRITWN